MSYLPELRASLVRAAELRRAAAAPGPPGSAPARRMVRRVRDGGGGRRRRGGRRGGDRARRTRAPRRFLGRGGCSRGASDRAATTAVAEPDVGAMEADRRRPARDGGARPACSPLRVTVPQVQSGRRRGRRSLPCPGRPSGVRPGAADSIPPEFFQHAQGGIYLATITQGAAMWDGVGAPTSYPRPTCSGGGRCRPVVIGGGGRAPTRGEALRGPGGSRPRSTPSRALPELAAVRGAHAQGMLSLSGIRTPGWGRWGGMGCGCGAWAR